MEKIPSTMVLHKHVDVTDTKVATVSVPLPKNPLGNWPGLIIRGTQQAAYEDIRWTYEQVSCLWPDIYPDSDMFQPKTGCSLSFSGM